MSNKTKESMRMIYDFSQDETANNLEVWDEIIASKNASNLFYFPGTATSKVRLLGPFFVVKRVFVPESLLLSHYITTEELKQIVLKENGISLENKLLKNLREYKEKHPYNGRVPLKETENAIHSFSNQSWQKAILINGYIQRDIGESVSSNKNIKIITFTPKSIRQLQLSVHNKRCPNAKINGLVARDILIKRNIENVHQRMSEIKTDINMEIDDETTILPEEAINIILKNGLIDIKKAIKSNNNKNLERMNGYFHILEEPDFKAPEEFSSLLMAEINKHKQELAIQKLSNYKNENLPPEATDDQDDLNNPIMNMDID